jgi:hypothetical protein
MKPGRPPLDHDDPSVKLTLTLPSKQLDQICAQAKLERMPLAEYMRTLVKAGVLKNTLK